MSGLFRLLSMLFLLAMLLIGTYELIEFAKERREEYIASHDPDLVLENGTRCWVGGDDLVLCRKKKQTLPEECAPFYDQPGDEWADCMGVGKK